MGERGKTRVCAKKRKTTKGFSDMGKGEQARKNKMGRRKTGGGRQFKGKKKTQNLGRDEREREREREKEPIHVAYIRIFHDTSYFNILAPKKLNI